MLEQGIYAKVVKISRKGFEFSAENREKMKQNSITKIYILYYNVGLILTLIRLRFILEHMSLINIRNAFRSRTIHRIQIYFETFKFE